MFCFLGKSIENNSCFRDVAGNSCMQRDISLIPFKKFDFPELFGPMNKLTCPSFTEASRMLRKFWMRMEVSMSAKVCD